MRGSRVAVIGLLLTVVPAFAGTNSWKVGSGKWEALANWSAGVPSLADAANLITNAGSPTVKFTGRQFARQDREAESDLHAGGVGRDF